MAYATRAEGQSPRELTSKWTGIWLRESPLWDWDSRFRSPFTVHRSPFTVYRSPFGVGTLAFGVLGGGRTASGGLVLIVQPSGQAPERGEHQPLNYSAESRRCLKSGNPVGPYAQSGPIAVSFARAEVMMINPKSCAGANAPHTEKKRAERMLNLAFRRTKNSWRCPTRSIGASSKDYFFTPRTASLAALATRNLTTVLAGILIFC
jgi:hypothetical protein